MSTSDACLSLSFQFFCSSLPRRRGLHQCILFLVWSCLFSCITRTQNIIIGLTASWESLSQPVQSFNLWKVPKASLGKIFSGRPKHMVKSFTRLTTNPPHKVGKHLLMIFISPRMSTGIKEREGPCSGYSSCNLLGRELYRTRRSREGSNSPSPSMYFHFPPSAPTCIIASLVFATISILPW